MKTKLLLPILFACSLFKMQAQEWGYGFIDESIYMRNIWTQGLDTVYIVGNNGLIARSTDQGETWEKQYFPNEAALNDIMFINHYTGFAVGEQGTILKTTDAGETWEQVNILPENDRQLLDIAFRGNLGYFTGNYFTVFKTEDFGATWNKQAITEQSNPYENTRTHSINIMEKTTYLAVGNYLYSTENQTNWTPLHDNLWVTLSYGCLFFLNDNVGYFAFSDIAVGGNLGRVSIRRTTDSGKNWERIEDRFAYGSYSIDQVNKIKMINDMLGYAIFAQVLIKIPALNTDVGKIKIRNNMEFFVKQITENELVLKSESNPIKSVEVFDTLGKKIIHKKWETSIWETNLIVCNLPKSIYLIKVTHCDNTISIDKFLIR